MALFNLFERENLYIPGCFSEAYLRNIVRNYERIMKKLDIRFRRFSDFFCCGAILEEAGYEKQARKLAKENHELLVTKGVIRVITSCPNCFRMFSQNYKDMMPNWEIKTQFILEPILEALKNKNTKLGTYFNEPAVYYGSCYLSRYSNFYDIPREILKLIGFHLVEIQNNHDESLCCGSCGNLPLIDSELSKKIAKDFISDLKRQKVKKVITADSRAFKHLLSNITKEDGIEVFEFSEVLCEALGIKREAREKDENNEEQQKEKQQNELIT